jgi:hypothetical protein
MTQARLGVTSYRQGGAVPSEHMTVVPFGTTTVVLAGGDGLLLLMHPAMPKPSVSRKSDETAVLATLRPLYLSVRVMTFSLI